MRSLNSQPTKILSLALMLLRATVAFGDDTVDVRVYNDTAEEIVVTVYDMNAAPPEPVLVRQIIYGFAWFPTSLTPGIEGEGHVRWSAETTGTSFHRCGHRERRGLTNDAMLRVFTDSECAESAP
jgi:hypothetical protein